MPATYFCMHVLVNDGRKFGVTLKRLQKTHLQIPVFLKIIYIYIYIILHRQNVSILNDLKNALA